MQEYTKHYSVLKNEIIKFFSESPSASEYYADLTFGGGGHSFAIANTFPSSIIYATDQDEQAYKNGLALIEKNNLAHRIHLKKTNFENFYNWIHGENLRIKFKGIVIDLGVSSHHFDDAERGFSFRKEARLDMRMNIDDKDSLTAYDIINSFAEEDLANIFFEYGEERLSRRIAANIIEKRKTEVIETTTQLEDIVFHSYSKKYRFSKTHPATRVFQALRIYINRELEVLEQSIPKLFDLLDKGGRLAIISFHSLEDRIVKHQFKKIYQSNRELVKILTKRPMIPTQEELEENNRSRSAKLRVIEKTTEG